MTIVIIYQLRFAFVYGGCSFIRVCESMDLVFIVELDPFAGIHVRFNHMSF